MDPLIFFGWSYPLLMISGKMNSGQLFITELQQALDTLQMIVSVVLICDVIVDRPTQKLISKMDFVITSCF